MTIWDDRILEHLRVEGGMSVGELAKTDEVLVSQPHVSRRCKKLAEHGLVAPLANGVYVITEEGEAYLDGEYDAEAGVYLDTGETNGSPASNSGESEG